MAGTYGYEVDEDRAIATIRRVLDSGISALDTSNNYGEGRSERRIGAALTQAGGLPAGFRISSKADPLPHSQNLSGQRVLDSFHETSGRLGVDALPLYYLHDPERFAFDDLTRPGGAVDAMIELKRRGCVAEIGVGGGDPAVLERYIGLGVFDVVLSHNRFTLLDRSAGPLIDRTVNAGMKFVNAAPFASGMLAKDAAQAPRYRYRVADAATVQRTESLRAVCERHGVRLPAAAVQFSTRDSRISSTVVGVSAPERVDELITHARTTVPEEVWEELAAAAA